MKILRITLMTIMVTVCTAEYARAVGTLAGTDITNVATFSYVIDGSAITQTSLPTTFTVAEIIDARLTWQDVASVAVTPGSSDQVLTFLLSNIGNGDESFSLSAQSGTAVLGGDFDPALTGIFFDTNGNGIYDDSGADVQYNGSNQPLLAPDSTATLFLVNAIPAGATNGQIGNSELTVTSDTGTGAAGTKLAGAGDGGLDAIIGASGGTSAITGSYVVSAITVVIDKTAAVIDDPFGGTDPLSGATIRYTITVTVSGSGTATSLVITDPIPADTTYKAGTLQLDAALLTDAADADEGDMGISTANTVTVSLGDVVGGAAANTITFDVTIN